MVTNGAVLIVSRLDVRSTVADNFGSNVVLVYREIECSMLHHWPERSYLKHAAFVTLPHARSQKTLEISQIANGF